MRLATWLCATLALGAGIASCSDSGKKEATSSEKTSMAVAEALTSGAKFDGGLIKSGLIPKATAEDVDITQDDPPLELAPGDSALMSLNVENPEQDDDPVVATLIQFDGSDDHVEVGVGDADGGVADGGVADASGSIETSFQLDGDVCKSFCNKKFAVKMFQAVKLHGGGVSEKIERSFNLDCTLDGDPDLCPKDDKGDKGGDDGDDTGDDGDDEPSKPTARSATLTSAMAAFNRASCVDCDGKSQAYCPTAPFPKDTVDCVAKQIDDNGDDATVRGWASCVASGLAGVNGTGGAALTCKQSCGDDACSASAFATAAEACNALPDDVQSGIDACMVVPDAGAAL
jgi:hypothetical protein